MHTKTVIHGMATALAVTSITFLLVVRVRVGLQPPHVELQPPDAALGYSSSLTALCSNMQAYWKFDDGSGTQATDISENGHHGTLQNMGSSNWSTAVSSGLGFANTAALTFDGTEEYVSVPASAGLRITGDLTLSLWVNYDALSSAVSGNVLIAHGTAGETEATNILYQFSVKSDNTLRLQWESSTGTDTVVESSEAASMSASQWYHLAATRDSSTSEVKFYVGGSLLGSAQSFSSDPTGGSDGSVVVGRSADGTHYFDGAIDDVRVYTSVLTGGQILALASGTDAYGGCSCGNSSVESPEACDDGASNSDTTADACRTTCVTASCGDGVVDSGEACDDGNSVNTDSCTNSCTISTCGDEAIQDGEECDDGSANSDTEPNACRTTCKLPSCGDGVVDLGETCDDGGASGRCDADCTEPVCGDGVVNTAAGEECDDGSNNSDTEVDACRTDCTQASCGDGVKDTGEVCDDGNSDSTDICTAECKTPSCGDGYIQESNNETCEPPNTATCASNCTGITGGGGSRSRSRSTAGVTYLVDDNGGDDGDNGDEEGEEEVEPPPEDCGNRIWEPEKGEECDEGNRNGRGPCSYYCKLLYCGDGIVSSEIYEECEPPIVSVLDGIPQFEEPTCGEVACSTPNIDPVTGRVIGGCKRLFLEPCEERGDTEESSFPEEEGAVCGNARVEEGEECDDGNTEENDGCSGTCKEEMCGDGIVQEGEECDNGSVCSNDSSVSCTSNLACGITLSCEENERGEMTCGGELDGDVCESAFDCSFFGTCEYAADADPLCTSSCTLVERKGGASGGPLCGDGTVDEGEECDDGNTEGGDGCSAFCREEHFCGDGTVDEGEECDDGNTEEGDGCSLLCTLEGGAEESVQGELARKQEKVAKSLLDPEPRERMLEKEPASVCGNRIVESGEECDDGPYNSDMKPNTCRTNCLRARCGDGTIDLGEQCDTGENNSDTRPDACRMECLLPFCGDGTIDSDEECDGGDSCGRDCRFLPRQAMCGNGILEYGEGCDDGNTRSGDGCNQRCKEEPKILSIAVCGNGKLESGEECDDGNLSNGDGCSALCIAEPMLEVLQTQTRVAGESVFGGVSRAQQSQQDAAEQQVQPATGQRIVFKQQPVHQRVVQMRQQQWVQPGELQQGHTLEQWQLLAQLQQQYLQLSRRSIPISPQGTPVGNTGPALLGVLSAGVAAGVGYMRRRKK